MTTSGLSSPIYVSLPSRLVPHIAGLSADDGLFDLYKAASAAVAPSGSQDSVDDLFMEMLDLLPPLTERERSALRLVSAQVLSAGDEDRADWIFDHLADDVLLLGVLRIRPGRGDEHDPTRHMEAEEALILWVDRKFNRWVARIVAVPVIAVSLAGGLEKVGRIPDDAPVDQVPATVLADVKSDALSLTSDSLELLMREAVREAPSDEGGVVVAIAAQNRAIVVRLG